MRVMYWYSGDITDIQINFAFLPIRRKPAGRLKHHAVTILQCAWLYERHHEMIRLLRNQKNLEMFGSFEIFSYLCGIAC